MAKTAVPRVAVSKEARRRRNVPELAGELGNLAGACGQRGMERTSFHEWKRRFQTRGFEGLKDLPPFHNGHPQTTPPETVKRIRAPVLAHPFQGGNRHEAMLVREGIAHDSQMEEAHHGRNMGDVGDPEPVPPRRLALAADPTARRAHRSIHGPNAMPSGI